MRATKGHRPEAGVAPAEAAVRGDEQERGESQKERARLTDPAVVVERLHVPDAERCLAALRYILNRPPLDETAILRRSEGQFAEGLPRQASTRDQDNANRSERDGDG